MDEYDLINIFVFMCSIEENLTMFDVYYFTFRFTFFKIKK